MGKCIQYAFLSVNLIVFVGGICLTALSILFVVGSTSIIGMVNQVREDISGDEEIPDAFLEMTFLVKSVVYSSLVMGLLMLLIGFLGCWGAGCNGGGKQNKCMLNLFAVIVTMLILAEISVVVMSFVYYLRVDTFMKNRFESYKTTSSDNSELFNKEYVDRLQRTVKCCGWESFEEYKTDLNTTLPATCCEEEGCTTPQFDNGCKEEVQNGLTIIGGVVIGCVFMQIISIISACFITKKTDGVTI